MRKYFSLMIRTGTVWHGPEFGSYDEEECKEEAYAYIINGQRARVVTSGDLQQEINDAVSMFHLGTLPRPTTETK